MALSAAEASRQLLDAAHAHHQAGQLAEAEALYRQILAQQPDHPDALNLLGAIAHQCGHHDHAIDLIARAVRSNPQRADFHYNLGKVLQTQNRLDEALASYQRAVHLNANMPDAHNNLGTTLRDLGRLTEAIACYQRAIDLDPSYPNAHYNLGHIHKQQGRALEAIECFRRAVALGPEYPPAHHDLALALYEQGQFAEAVACYQHAVARWPNLAAMHANLGSALKDQGRLDEAIAAYRRAVEVDPALSHAHSNLILALNYHPASTAESIYLETQRWHAQHAAPLKAAIRPHPNDPAPDRRLRIGYVSADFCNHAAALFIGTVLKHHSATQVETFCYASVERPDAITAQLRAVAHHWRDIARMSDDQAAELVRGDRIDILIDLAGHTSGNRLLLFARKPAPVQVTCHGYPGTTGLATIDYRLTNAHADPPGGADEAFYTEKLVRLPETFFSFQAPDESPAVAPPPARARGHVTFASFHALAKFNDELLGWWARILEQLPTARLLLVAAGLGEASTRQRLIDVFANRSVAADRLDFKPNQSMREYLELHQQVDVLLDCHPWSSHTVACIALWMGVPVVTLAGVSHRSRMVTNALMNLDLAELVAHSPEEYIQIAANLAGDIPRLERLRSSLRQQLQASPRTDPARLAGDLEAAYRQMWQTWCTSRHP